MTVGDVLQKQFHFLIGNNVTDALRVIQVAEGQPDHFVPDHRRAAAVAGIDHRIDLDAQAGNGEIIRDEFHA